MIRIYAEIDGKRYEMRKARSCCSKKECSLFSRKCQGDDCGAKLPCLKGKFGQVYAKVWEMADSAVAFKEV